MKEIIVVVASLLAVVGNVPYLRDVIKGRVKPHPYTWLVWSIVSFVVFFGVLAKGGGVGVIPVAVSEIFTFLIFLFSIKYGFKNPPKRDKYFLILALFGLIPWILSHDPTISVIIMVSIDLIGFLPTLYKTFYEPKTETSLLYLTNVVRHSLILSVLGAYNIATVLHSIVMIITNTLMVVFIKIHKENGALKC